MNKTQITKEYVKDRLFNDKDEKDLREFILLDGKLLTGWFYILIGIGFPIANLLEYRKKGL